MIRSRISYLYHLTSFENLPNIMKNGLLSHHEAHTKGLVLGDISDSDVQDRRSKVSIENNKQLHHYVCLYFSARNPMLYRRRDQQENIIIMGINPAVLSYPGTIITDGNAASEKTKFYAGDSDITYLPWEIIHAQYWHDFPDGKRIACAEILVYPKVEVQDILRIFCYSEKQCAACSTVVGSKIKAEKKSDLYF